MLLNLITRIIALMQSGITMNVYITHLLPRLPWSASLQLDVEGHIKSEGFGTLPSHANKLCFQKQCGLWTVLHAWWQSAGR